MRFFLIASWSCAALVVLAACGGNVAISTGGSGTGAHTTTSSSSSSTTSASSSGASPSGCPASEPAAGATCTVEGVTCTYGTGIVAECRPTYTCQKGTWQGGAGGCPMDVACPGTEPQAQAACDGDAGATSCPYPSGDICSCGPCPPVGPICASGPSKWWCDSPSGGAGCPTLIPNEGAACSSPGATCSYPDFGCGISATCTSGAWTWMQEGCPG